MQGYLPLMHEFAIRADLVAKALTGDLELTPPFAREFAYLHYRRMCELIALGSLYLHGDLPIAQQNALTKEWHAEKLMKLLHKHHAYAFPQSVEIIQSDKGWNIQANNKPNALKYPEFLKLYAECGNVLHRGNIRTVHSTGFITQADFEKTQSWQVKLVTLMNEHAITRANIKGLYVISLRTSTNYPECTIMDFMPDNTVNAKTIKMVVGDDVVNAYVSNNQ